MSTAPRPHSAHTHASSKHPAGADEQEPEKPLDKGQVSQALYVALAGAVGGLLFWMLGKYSGTVTFAGWPWFGQIPALMFLGAMAGLFGVYLLTSSSLNSMRTYIFAIVCGVVWQPIINTAMQSVVNATATKHVEEVSTQAEQLKSSADKGSIADVTIRVNATVPAVTQAIQQLPDVQDAGKKQEIVDSSQKAISALEVAANKAPNSSIDGIKQVGIAASTGNHTTVSIHAVQSLRTIGLAAAHEHPEVAKLTADSLQAIASSSNDPSVKSAVEASLKELTVVTQKPIDQPPRRIVQPTQPK